MSSTASAAENLEMLCERIDHAFGSDWDSYFQLTEEAIKLARELSDNNRLIGLLIKRAEVHYRRGNLELAELDLATAQAALEMLPGDIRYRYEATILRWQGHTARSKHDLEDALRYYKQALKIALQAGASDIEAKIRYNLGIFYCEDCSDFDSAIAEFKRVFQNPQAPPETLTYCLSQLAFLCYTFGDTTSAKAYMEQIDYKRSYGHGDLAINCRLGEISSAEGRHEDALTYFRMAENTAVQFEDKFHIFQTLTGQATALAALGRKEERIDVLNRSLKMANNNFHYCYAHGNLALFFLDIIETSNCSNMLNENLEKFNYHLSAAESYSTDLPLYRLVTYLEFRFDIEARIKDYPTAVQTARRLNELKHKVLNSKVQSEISSLRLLIKIEREEHAKQIEQMKREQTEKELATASVHLAMQTELLANFRNDLRQIVREIDEPINALKRIKEKLKTLPCEQIDWLKFEKQFTDVHPEFRARLIEKYPDLTKQEVKMCQLARLGLKSIEMAQLLCLSERSVETHRFNLRKKLGLKTEQNLTEFLAGVR